MRFSNQGRFREQVRFLSASFFKTVTCHLVIL